jgi:hypothetical protein
MRGARVRGGVSGVVEMACHLITSYAFVKETDRWHRKTRTITEPLHPGHYVLLRTIYTT